MTGKKMVDLYIHNGWRLDRIHGSHYIMKKNGSVEVIPVHPGKDLAKGMESYLLKRIGMK